MLVCLHICVWQALWYHSLYLYAHDPVCLCVITVHVCFPTWFSAAHCFFWLQFILTLWDSMVGGKIEWGRVKNTFTTSALWCVSVCECICVPTDSYVKTSGCWQDLLRTCFVCVRMCAPTGSICSVWAWCGSDWQPSSHRGDWEQLWEERDLTASQLSALRGGAGTNAGREERESLNRLVGYTEMRTEWINEH